MLTEILVHITVASVLVMLGAGFLYMVIKDLGIENECGRYILLIDSFIAILKRLINRLYQCNTHKDNKRKTNESHNNGDGNTHPNIIFSKIFNKSKCNPPTKTNTSKITNKPPSGSCTPKLNDTKNQNTRKYSKNNSLKNIGWDKRYKNKDNSENDQNSPKIIFTHKLPLSFITAIISKYKGNSNQIQFNCKTCLESLYYLLSKCLAGGKEWQTYLLQKKLLVSKNGYSASSMETV